MASWERDGGAFLASQVWPACGEAKRVGPGGKPWPPRLSLTEPTVAPPLPPLHLSPLATTALPAMALPPCRLASLRLHLPTIGAPLQETGSNPTTPTTAPRCVKSSPSPSRWWRRAGGQALPRPRHLTVCPRHSFSQCQRPCSPRTSSPARAAMPTTVVLPTAVAMRPCPPQLSSLHWPPCPLGSPPRPWTTMPITAAGRSINHGTGVLSQINTCLAPIHWCSAI